MGAWQDYRQQARARGALAKELFMVRSIPAGAPDAIAAARERHLAYQSALEARGVLVLAGPLSDADATGLSGEGLIVYRAASLAEARALADGDPMHALGLKTYELRAWLVNEGALDFSLRLSTQEVAFR